MKRAILRHDVVLAFDAPDVTLEAAGGKGCSLTALVRADLPVPWGFHVSADTYRRFIGGNNLQVRILDHVNGSSESDAADAIGALFSDVALGDELAAPIKAAYVELGDADPVAVRSSANAEDLPDASFAGQQETYLNVIGVDAVLQAVKDCWCSLWTPRAISYRQQMGIPHEDVAMAVVVQRMVQADVSGILFTANPATGERGEMIVNASYGLGEAIVSGQVTPDTYRYDRDQHCIVESLVGTKEQMIISDGEGGTLWQEIRQRRREALSLSEAKIGELASLAERAEAHFGSPQDIEWAIKDDELFLLQSRPITNLPPPPLKDLKWEPPAPGVTLLRRQIVENMPGPLSPLFEELYLDIGLQQGMNRSLARSDAPYTIEDMTNGNVHLTVNGYAYQRRDFKAPDVEPDVMAEFSKKGQIEWWTELVNLWRDDWLPQYQAVIEEASQLDIPAVTDEVLLSTIRSLANEDAYYWEESSKVFATAKVTDEQLQGFLKQAAPDYQFTSGMFLSGFESRTMRAQLDIWLIAQQIQATPTLMNMVSDTAAVMLHEQLLSTTDASEVVAAIDRYNNTYGHQIYSLDFVEPTASEDLSPIMVALKAQVADEDYDPGRDHLVVAAKRRAAMREIREVLSEEQMWQFRWHLWKARHFYPHREEVVFWLGAAWPLLRRIAHELGQRLVDVGTFKEADDLYFLVSADIEAAITARSRGEAVAGLADRASAARELREARKRIHPPGAIPVEQHDNAAATQKLNARDSKVLSGFAVSPGRIEGEVSVILTPADFDKMKPNTILVCPMTTPAWTQLFSHAIALVTDIGSILAHGSIVAREFGIPAVLGLGDVTQRLKSGQRVRVDGDAGTVEILEEAGQ